MPAWRCWGALAAALAVGGCAQIVVVRDNEPPQSEWRFGVLAIEIAPSSRNTIVQTSGIGIVSTPAGSTLGYANARIVRIGDECRVVVTTRDVEAIHKDRELLRLLASAGKACAA